MARKQSIPKEQPRREVRKTAGENAPPISTPPPPGAATPSAVSEPVELQAQKLIHEAGSPNAAKTAVDVAAERENAPDFQEDHFALRWGFASRAELRAASKPLTAADGCTWWATELPNGRWIRWNKEDMAAQDSFATLDEIRGKLDARAL